MAIKIYSVSISAPLLFLSLALVSCNSKSGPVTGFDLLSPTVTTEFGRLNFSSVPTSALASACLGPFIVEIEDANGNPMTNETGSDVSLTLSESSGTATFFSDSSCVDSFDPNVDHESIPNGASSVGFYLEFPVAVSNDSISASANDNNFSGSKDTGATLVVN